MKIINIEISLNNFTKLFNTSVTFQIIETVKAVSKEATFITFELAQYIVKETPGRTEKLVPGLTS